MVEGQGKADNLAALNQRAWDLLEEQPKAALELAEQADGLARRRGDALEQARSLRTLGGCYNLLFDYGRAASVLNEALALSESQQAAELQLDVLVLLCRVHYSLGNYQIVLERGAQALPLARRQERAFEQAVLLNVMGHAFRVLGLYTEALEYYQASLHLFEMLNHPRRSHPLCGIATVYEHLGNTRQALAYYRMTLEHEEALGLERDAAITRSCLGGWHLNQGEADRAEPLLRGSLDVFLRHGDHYNAAAVLLKLGDLHRRTSQIDASLAAYRQVLSLGNPPNPWHQATALLGMSRGHRESGNRETALQHAHEALSLVGRQGARAISYDIHLELSALYEEQDDLTKAFEHFKAFHALKEEVMGQEAQNLRQALMIQFDTERAQKDREIYRLRNVELARVNEELRALHRQVEQLSVEDALTELHNRRFLNLRLDEEFRRARRYGHPLSLMLADIDNFKHVNDDHSHAVGDKVLQTVAGILKQHTRATDIMVRYGGEEFVAIFPETGLQEAAVLAEALREKVAAHPWHDLHPGLGITISIGLADNAQADVEAMLELADKRMYEAKRLGKNRVRY